RPILLRAWITKAVELSESVFTTVIAEVEGVDSLVELEARRRKLFRGGVGKWMENGGKSGGEGNGGKEKSGFGNGEELV
ncbi:hypothetical protein A2U01_0095206, partial [Trifolium medium]|nr:hypothetical protein [Trifolium medium]